MHKVAVFLVPQLVDAQGGKEDPTAPCGSRDNECCMGTDEPVMGGVDFVDLADKTQGTDGPELGITEFTASLNGYAFLFKSAVNAATFTSDPWRYAPRYGAF